MKKSLLQLGIAVLVVAFPFSSMAQFKSWGHIEIQTIWEAKPDFNTGQPWQFDSFTRNPRRNLQWRNVAERYRFFLQYGDPKIIRAVLGFEANSLDWGEAAGGGTNGNNPNIGPYYGSAYQATGMHFGVYRSDQVQLEVKHAYIDFTIPNTPINLSAGVQLFELGGRLWMNNDAPGVIVTGFFFPHRIRGFWWRINDNNRFTYGVNDMYALAWDMARPLYSLGLWGAYLNDLFTGEIGSYTYPATVTGSTPSTWGINPANGMVQTETYTITLTTPINKYDDHPWWVGLSGGFRPGNWDFSGQFIYNGGKRQFKGRTVNAATPTAGLPPAVQGDTTYQAWIAELYGRYRIGPGLFAGIEGYYASGQNWDKPDKITQFTLPLVSESQSIFGNDRTVFMWMNSVQIGYLIERNFSITGFWYARGNVEYSPLSWLRMNLNYLYIGDTSSGTPGIGVSPFTRLATTKPINTPIGARQDLNKGFVGQEFNLITTLRIYQNLDYNVGAYVFFPSDIFDRVDTTGKTIQGASTSYGVNTKLVYAF